MGVSAFFSLSKRYEGAGREAFSRILRRSAVIFGVGLLLQEISYFGYGTANFLSGQTPAGAIWFETAFPFRTFRIMGVLQGLALAYLFGSAALLCLHFRHLIAAAGGLRYSIWCCFKPVTVIRFRPTTSSRWWIGLFWARAIFTGSGCRTARGWLSSRRGC